jgi:hypothetical protein
LYAGETGQQQQRFIQQLCSLHIIILQVVLSIQAVKSTQMMDKDRVHKWIEKIFFPINKPLLKQGSASKIKKNGQYCCKIQCG